MKKSQKLAKIINLFIGLVTVLSVTFFISTTLVFAAVPVVDWIGPTQSPPAGNPGGFIFSRDPDGDPAQNANIYLGSGSKIRAGNIQADGDLQGLNVTVNGGQLSLSGGDSITSWADLCDPLAACGFGGGDELWTLAANGTDIYRAAGNVGIGTASPGGALHIAAWSDSVPVIKFGSGTYGWKFFERATDGDLQIKREVASTEYDVMYLQRATGNVGIGTVSPAAKLDIVGGGGAAVDLQVSGRIRSNSASGGLWLNNANDGFVGANGNNIGFWTSPVGWNAFQIVKATGFIGIGTQAPNKQLHIKTASGNAEIDIQSVSSPLWGIYQDDTTDDLRFWNVDNRMTITNEGNVGIGTTAPVAALQVNHNQCLISTGIQNPCTTSLAQLKTTSIPTPMTASRPFRSSGVPQLIINPGPDKIGRIEFLGNQSSGIIGFTDDDSRFTGISHLFGLWVVDANNPGGISLLMDTHNGNVGIGTSAPLVKLSLGTDQVSATSKKLAIYDGVNDFYGFGIDAAKLLIWAGNNKVMTLNNSGNVGIGTTDPQVKLHVQGNLADIIRSRVQNTNNAGAAVFQAMSGSNVASLGVNSPGRSTTLPPNYGWLRSEPGGLAFLTAGDNVRMVIDPTGNVGIGTASPGSKLDAEAGNTYQYAGEFNGNGGYFGLYAVGSILAGRFDGNLQVNGNLQVSGTKNFVQDYPNDPTKQIVYYSLEGGESGTYTRGSGQLVQGEATINLPEHFNLVSSDQGITVQITPTAETSGLYVVSKSNKQVVVKELGGGKGNATFDYLVQGVRKGYENAPVIVDKKTANPPTPEEMKATNAAGANNEPNTGASVNNQPANQNVGQLTNEQTANNQPAAPQKTSWWQKVVIFFKGLVGK